MSDTPASEHRLELLAAILLALAAIATAWATYQSSVWRGKQAQAQSASIAARVESTRQAGVANRQAQIDLALLLNYWVISLFYIGRGSVPSSSGHSKGVSPPDRARTRMPRSRRSSCRSTDWPRPRRQMLWRPRQANSALR